MVSECEGRETIKIQERPVLSGLSHVDGLVQYLSKFRQGVEATIGGKSLMQEWDSTLSGGERNDDLSLSFEKMRAT